MLVEFLWYTEQMPATNSCSAPHVQGDGFAKTAFSTGVGLESAQLLGALGSCTEKEPSLLAESSVPLVCR